MSQAVSSICANLERLRNQIADICARSQRRPADIGLMAVSKLHPVEAILEAYAAGQRLFGENRVQEWQSKSEALANLGLNVAPAAQQDSGSQALESQALEFQAADPEAADSDFRMHLIGPLQNNKTSRAAQLFHSIDTVDSPRTAERLNNSMQPAEDPLLEKTLPVLIEVKLSPEDTKHGVAPEELPALLAALVPLTHLRVSGLMTVPPWSEDPEIARPYFRRLRRLRDDNVARYPTLTELSMGMSNDFRVAIEEGSTTIRLGTAIFGKRNAQQT